jgi:hypothetical protein
MPEGGCGDKGGWSIVLKAHVLLAARMDAISIAAWVRRG